MERFGKLLCLVLIGLILWLVLDKREKDISGLLTLAVCCAVAAGAAVFLQPVLELIWQLEAMGQLQEGLLGILLKAVGIHFLSEVVATVCTDAGNGSMGSITRFLGSCVMLYTAIPVFSALLELIREILGVL